MMDKSPISQPLRRLLKQFELSSLNSLHGPSLENNTNNSFSSPLNNATSSLSPIRPNAEKALTVEKFGYRDSLLDILATISSVKEQSGASTIQMAPVMTPRDHSTERHETLLEGEVISCFVVGGEKRLCLPQVLNAVLRDYSLQEINKACTELHIHCSQCSKDQLEVLKVVGVLPMSSSNCGLITKTDAERLSNYLSHSRRARRNRTVTTSNVNNNNNTSATVGEKRFCSSILPVYHECFGRCRGRYVDDKYTSLSAECIECDECNELYAPDRFVLHSHRNHETKTCHWGFDSANWRAYLHLTPEIEEVKEAQIQLDNMKAKFQNVGGITKRSHDLTATTEPSCKRQRFEQPSLESQLGVKVQTPVPVQLTQTLQPFVLCDPLLMAYYQALTNSRLSLCSAGYPSSLLPFMSALGSQSLMTGPPLNSAVEEAAAALLKLAPQTSKDIESKQVFDVQQPSVVPDTPVPPCWEPLKKHILHRSQSKQNVADDNCQRRVSGKDHSTDAEDSETLETLLCRYINDTEGLRIIKAKLDETKKNLDNKLDSLTAQNRILQQEIAYLRNKQTAATCAASILTTVSP